MTVSHKQQGYIEQRTKTDENIDNSCGYAARLNAHVTTLKLKIPTIAQAIPPMMVNTRAIFV